jgi:hypothetical protein
MAHELLPVACSVPNTYNAMRFLFLQLGENLAAPMPYPTSRPSFKTGMSGLPLRVHHPLQIPHNTGPVASRPR